MHNLNVNVIFVIVPGRVKQGACPGDPEIQGSFRAVWFPPSITHYLKLSIRGNAKQAKTLHLSVNQGKGRKSDYRPIINDRFVMRNATYHHEATLVVYLIDSVISAA